MLHDVWLTSILLAICTHRGPTNFSAMKMAKNCKAQRTTIKTTESKETQYASTHLICLAQQVQGGSSLPSPAPPPPPTSYGPENHVKI